MSFWSYDILVCSCGPNPSFNASLGDFFHLFDLYPPGKIKIKKYNNHKSHCLENGKPFPNKPHDFEISL